MANARSSSLPHQVRTLFGVGVVAGLSDAELLERFTAQSAAAEDAALAAEAAFAALVARHGPMVLGVCRRALADPNDVEDAFQATFLVLVRRAGSVRVGDSLGRWLYGVARRVAAKARARSEGSRARSVPLAVEPIAPETSADRMGLLAALDEEVSRLPEKYRAPVVLCHLEGLTHAEAADRLRWPVGTVSGRLSRGRDLLKDRLVRRGLAPTAGSMVALLATEAARAAVPNPLTAATVRAATRLAMGGASQAGAVSASALSLVNAVLRAAVAVKLRVAAAVLLVFAAAGVAVEGGLWIGTRNPASDQDIGRIPAVASDTLPHPPADHRPADENPFGTIKGRLVWGGDDLPPPLVLEAAGKASKDPNVCAKNNAILSRELVVDPKTKGVSYGIAYLLRPKGNNPQAVKNLIAQHPTAELDQLNCEFQPYVLPMHQDQTLVIKASDAINHNVRVSAFTNESTNRTLIPQGKLALKLAAERHPIKMACDIHPWMKSYVMVFDHPFFTTTAADGSFEIEGVPPGPQKLVIWQERAGYATPGLGSGMTVEVTAGQVKDVGEIKLPIKPGS